MEISPSDWEALQRLSTQVGMPAERVGLLRRRVENSSERPGSPYALIVGRPDAGIELLLARWLAVDAADELRKVGDCPLVIGATPAEVRPRLGVWPTWKWPKFGPGHIIALRTHGKPAANTLAQLSSLGLIDQAVVVTRLGQPLHMMEREIASCLAVLAATVRVLIVGLPGEEPTESELAEVSAFAINQMRQAGFRQGRCFGAGIWFTGESKANGTIADVGEFLSVDLASVAAGRQGMMRFAVASLVNDIAQRTEKLPAALAPIADDESDRLVRELGSYLADLGRELNRQLERPLPTTTETLRKYALDALRSWGSYSGIEGHWLKYVDRLRPGTQAAFLKEAESALALLDFQPGSVPVEAASPNDSSPIVGRWIVEAKRLGVGLALAFVGYVLATKILGPDGANWPALAISLASYVVLVVGGGLGYVIARSFIRAPHTLANVEAPASTPAALHGWLQLERRLTGWFSDHIRAKPASPADECLALAQRFSNKEFDV